jgi:hypothetical protein
VWPFFLGFLLGVLLCLGAGGTFVFTMRQRMALEADHARMLAEEARARAVEAEVRARAEAEVAARNEAKARAQIEKFVDREAKKKEADRGREKRE